MSSKAVLRKQLKTKILELSKCEKMNQSEFVYNKVLYHPKYKKCTNVAIFLSMPDEIDTTPILKDIFNTNKKCFIPFYSEVPSKLMKMLPIYLWNDYLNLSLTKWNIKQHSEIQGNESLDIYDKNEELDLMFVPGLAFTNSGLRLGRGKGYYDRYLAYIKQKNITNGVKLPYIIALCYKISILSYIPTDAHDMIVDEIIYQK
ncbi:unnamed protein product [Gordionus sp. m RMFG-2023]|uniref:5-formyltetrahydrofolate cyclo-ligase-like n=1 Tax=Gordionus sp. m RMFG-2023 TaxID=3053472 RepID=UPI0030E20E1C